MVGVEQLTFPMTLNIDGLDQLNFGGAIGSGFGLDAAGHINSRVIVPGPWGDDPIVFASIMTINNFALSFELRVNQPTLANTRTGLGLRLHQFVLNFRLSVPFMRLEQVTFEVPDGYACSSVYTVGLCIAHGVAEAVFRDIMRGVFNDVMAAGLNQFTPGDDVFLDEDVDLTGMVNEGLADMTVDHPAVDAICGIVNGCGGKTMRELVGGSRIWIMMMFFMFTVFFSSFFWICCAGCCFMSAKPRPPSTIVKAHKALNSLASVQVTITKAPNAAFTTFGLSFQTTNGQISVTAVEANSEAARAGVRVGDKLMTINGALVTSVPYATKTINGAAANQALILNLRRSLDDVQMQTMEAASSVSAQSAMPVVAGVSVSSQPPPYNSPADVDVSLGETVINFNVGAPLGIGLKNKNGVVVVESVEPTSAAAAVTPGAQLTAVNDEDVRKLDKAAIIKVVTAAKAKGHLTITFFEEEVQL